MIDGMLSIAAGFVVLTGSRKCLLKKGFARQWSGIAHTRVGGRRSSPRSFGPVTSKCIAGVFRKDGHAGPDYRGERSAWLRSPARTCAAQIDFDGLPDLRSDQVLCEDQVASAQSDLVIHAAAYTDVDGAEHQLDLAMAVNAQGTEWVARGATRAKARLIYILTDYVFDGLKRTPYLETDLANPLNFYGKSKLEGERRALAHCPDALVVRTSWLYGAYGKNFVKTMLRLAMEQPELRVVADQRGSLTYAEDLAQALAKVLMLDIRGIVHAMRTGDCTGTNLRLPSCRRWARDSCASHDNR